MPPAFKLATPPLASAAPGVVDPGVFVTDGCVFWIAPLPPVGDVCCAVPASPVEVVALGIDWFEVCGFGAFASGAFCCGGGAGCVVAGGVGSLGGVAVFVPDVPAGFVCVGIGNVDGFGVAEVCAIRPKLD